MVHAFNLEVKLNLEVDWVGRLNLQKQQLIYQKTDELYVLLAGNPYLIIQLWCEPSLFSIPPKSPSVTYDNDIFIYVYIRL